MARKKDIESVEFKNAIKNKKIPILTLDERWHELFLHNEKPFQIKQLENKLNEMMKHQGKQITKIKDMKALKSRLLKEIMNNMNAANEGQETINSKKQVKAQQLIMEINEKLKTMNDEIIEVPYEIQEINEQLMIATMKVCYEQLQYNQEAITKSSEWIEKARQELKDRLLDKQDKEMRNTEIYTYMHNTLGAQAIEVLDNEYNLKK